MTTPPVVSITEEMIAELESAATKATPGPWWIDSHGHRMSSEDGMKTVFIANDRMGPATRHPETGNLSHWPNDWEASFIALANPATILALLAERAELKKDAERPLNIEAAARKLAECMDYPWDYMPKQGRDAMRGHAQAVIAAAMQEPKP